MNEEGHLYLKGWNMFGDNPGAKRVLHESMWHLPTSKLLWNYRSGHITRTAAIALGKEYIYTFRNRNNEHDNGVIDVLSISSGLTIRTIPFPTFFVDEYHDVGSTSVRHESIVTLLLGVSSVSADSKNRFDQTPLSLAAQPGHDAVVKLLLDVKDVDANSKNTYRQTPLSVAARFGYEAVVKLLLGAKAVRVNSEDSWCQRPLWWAASNGHTSELICT
ncbi:MAG: hypothetical protein M1840_001261 [Geoglossum simile]|nr:MAG: hypothetical protein M1840_001261 [Geoglossum simile]